MTEEMDRTVGTYSFKLPYIEDGLGLDGGVRNGVFTFIQPAGLKTIDRPRSAECVSKVGKTAGSWRSSGHTKQRRTLLARRGPPSREANQRTCGGRPGCFGLFVF